jgi:uncharacterized membrane protein
MRLLMRWVHIAGVMTAIGGMVFLRLAVMPAIERLGAADADELLVRVIRRSTPFLHVALWAILGSGLYNLFHLQPGPVEGSGYIYIFFGKIALVSLLFSNAFVVAASARRGSVHPRISALLMRNVILAAAIVALSAYLRSLR